MLYNESLSFKLISQTSEIYLLKNVMFSLPHDEVYIEILNLWGGAWGRSALKYI